MSRLLRIGLGVAAGWVAYSRLRVPHSVPLARPVAATGGELVDRTVGDVAVYQRYDGEGAPVLLLHGVELGASAYDMRPLFDRLAGLRPVTAMDLPGFGHSRRGDIGYTPDLMADAVQAVLERVMEGPAHVVALSLGCELAARAAARRPDLVRSLAFISPTGLYRRPPPTRRWQRVPLLGQPIFDLLTTRLALRTRLGRRFQGETHPGLVAFAYSSAHQPGARFAPFAFLAGRLHTAGAVETLYEPLAAPVLVIHDGDPLSDLGLLPELLSRRPQWRVARIEGHRGLPQFEALDETMAALTGFWDEIER